MTDKNQSKLEAVLDHSTDIAAVAAIGTIAYFGDPSNATLTALTSIAIGKRVIKK